MNKLMLLVQFLCVYLYCRGVFYFGPHNISWLYEVGLHIYHCRIMRMEVVLAALVIPIYTDVQMFYKARSFILVNFR